MSDRLYILSGGCAWIFMALASYLAGEQYGPPLTFSGMLFWAWGIKEAALWRAVADRAIAILKSDPAPQPPGDREDGTAPDSTTPAAAGPGCNLAAKALFGSVGNTAHNDHPLRHFDRTCLACLLEHAKSTNMTPKEIYEQKISWIRGMSGKLSDPMPSREDVVKALAEMGIVDPEPSA